MPGMSSSSAKVNNHHPLKSLPNPPSLVESDHHRFLIFDAPNDENLPLYVEEWKKFKIRHVVRACDPTYDPEPLRAQGFTVHDMPFNDGGAPSDDVVHKWLALLQNTFREETADRETIGVHCVAGLGRAPVLVAIALIEDGMNPLEAVEYIRARRRGSINIKQIQFLKSYKVRSKKHGKGCTCM